MNRPFLWNPALWGSLLLTVAALLVSVNPASPLWLHTLLWIGLTLYNALWWLLQIPEYHTFQKDAASPEAQQELERLKRSIFLPLNGGCAKTGRVRHGCCGPDRRVGVKRSDERAWPWRRINTYPDPGKL